LGKLNYKIKHFIVLSHFNKNGVIKILMAINGSKPCTILKEVSLRYQRGEYQKFSEKDKG